MIRLTCIIILDLMTYAITLECLYDTLTLGWFYCGACNCNDYYDFALGSFLTDR